MSNPTRTTLQPALSPNGQLIVPSWAVPYILAVMMIAQVVGAAVALPGPWTVERTFIVIQGICSVLVGGALGGLRR